MDPETSPMGMPSVEAETKWILRGDGLQMIATLKERKKNITLSGNCIFSGEMLDTVFSIQKQLLHKKETEWSPHIQLDSTVVIVINCDKSTMYHCLTEVMK